MVSPFEGALSRNNQAKLLNSHTGEYEDDTPDMGEVYEASKGMMEREELSSSRYRNRQAALIPRNETVQNDIDNGTIPKEIADLYEPQARPEGFQPRQRQDGPAGYDYEGLVEHMNAKGSYYKTRKDAMDEMRHGLRLQREEDQQVLQESEGFGGLAAQFAGAAVASVKDPINIMAMGGGLITGLVRGSATGGASVLRGVAQGAKAGAVDAAVSESIIQGFVFPYKDDIDSPYSWSDALFNIAATTAFGAGLGGAAGGVGAYWRRGPDAAEALSESADEQMTALVRESAEVEAAGVDAPVEVAPTKAPKVDTEGVAVVDEAQTAGTVRTAAGTEVGYQWEIVDASDLITSDSKKFGGDLQPRDRGKAELKGQVEDIARQLDPQSLGSSRSAETGAPIIGPDNLVESGNGRVMALRRAKEKYPENYDSYRSFIERVSGRSTEGVKSPVLVRRRTTAMTPEERTRFTVEANKGTQAAFDAAEVARADAGQLGADAVALYRGGDVSLERNAQFVAKVLGDMPAGERNALSSDGRLTPDGITRLRNMLMVKAYSGTDDAARLLKDLATSTDDNARAISGALQDSAGRVAKLREKVVGTEHAVLDIGDKVIEALGVVQQLRKQKSSVSDWLAQDDILNPRNPELDALVRIFYDESGTRGVSRQKVATALDEYVDLAEQEMMATDMFGDRATPAELLNKARAISQGLDLKELRAVQTRLQADEASRVVLDESEDVTPEQFESMQVAADEIAVDRTMLDADGNEISMKAMLEEEQNKVNKIDEVITCMFGGE